MFSFSNYLNLSEAVSVKKQNYSWGRMITVHHGSDTSYPLHPEHQAKIKALDDGEKASFKDETKRTVTAHRVGDQIHLSGAGISKKTPVARSHFAEEAELGEASSKYKIKSVGTDKKGDYHIDPKTGEKVYGKASVGDHKNPKTGTITPSKPKPEFMEGAGQVDELSRGTLSSYISKASDARKHKGMPTSKVDKRYTGVAKASSRLDSKVNEATSAYDRINNRFKKLSGRSLGTAAKEYGDEVKDLQKKIDAQKAENERRQAALKKEHFTRVDETKSAPKGFHFTSDGRLKRGDADVDGPGGKKLRSDPLDKTRSKIPSVSESTPTSQQVKQAIGIARDKRYAKGNVTGAVKAINKLNPGLAQHPVVKKELQKQNEEKNKDDLPFTPDKPKTPSSMAGKYGLGHSTAKHLARMALSQQIKKKQNM